MSIGVFFGDELLHLLPVFGYSVVEIYECLVYPRMTIVTGKRQINGIFEPSQADPDRCMWECLPSAGELGRSVSRASVQDVDRKVVGRLSCSYGSTPGRGAGRGAHLVEAAHCPGPLLPHDESNCFLTGTVLGPGNADSNQAGQLLGS